MVEYNCIKCGKKFIKKDHYERHMQLKKPCDKYLYEIIEKELEIEKKEINDQIHINMKNELDLELIIANNTKIEKEIFGSKMCYNCGKTFKHGSSYSRHINTRCKNKVYEKQSVKDLEKLLLDKDREIEELKSKRIVIENITQNNTTNNYLQNNIINNNIKINPFGKENISYITDEILKRVIKNPELGIPNLIRMIHFNPLYPENMNVLLKNKRAPYVNVFNGSEWKVERKDDTIHNLICTKKDIADDYSIDKLEGLKLIENDFINIENCKETSISTLVDNDLKEHGVLLKYETYSDALDEYLNELVIEKDNMKSMFIKNRYKIMYKKLYRQIEIILLNHNELIKNNEIKNNEINKNKLLNK